MGGAKFVRSLGATTTTVNFSGAAPQRRGNTGEDGIGGTSAKLDTTVRFSEFRAYAPVGQDTPAPPGFAVRG
jgi:hypothetical protein